MKHNIDEVEAGIVEDLRKHQEKQKLNNIKNGTLNDSLYQKIYKLEKENEILKIDNEILTKANQMYKRKKNDAQDKFEALRDDVFDIFEKYR